MRAYAMKVASSGLGKLGQYMLQHALDRSYEVVGMCREQIWENSLGSRSAWL